MEEKKYSDAQFEWIRAELTRLRQAVEKLAETTISEKHFDRIVNRVSELENDGIMLTRRVDDVENDVSLMKWGVSFAVSIGSVVLGAWLLSVLGLR